MGCRHHQFPPATCECPAEGGVEPSLEALVATDEGSGGDWKGGGGRTVEGRRGGSGRRIGLGGGKYDERVEGGERVG